MDVLKAALVLVLSLEENLLLRSKNIFGPLRYMHVIWAYDVCVYIYTYIYIYMYVCIYVYMCVYTYTYIHRCMFASLNMEICGKLLRMSKFSHKRLCNQNCGPCSDDMRGVFLLAIACIYGMLCAHMQVLHVRDALAGSRDVADAAMNDMVCAEWLSIPFSLSHHLELYMHAFMPPVHCHEVKHQSCIH